MLTYSVLPTPKKYSERSKSVTFSDKTTTTCCDDDERKEQLKQADDHVRDSYDLLWNQKKYEDAIHSLMKALQIQQQYLGKQDKEVGWSCSFLGTALWLSGDNKQGLKYLLEARRIFCKCGKGNIKGIDQRIFCILGQQGLNSERITAFQTNVKRTINHELQGDSYKKLGLVKQARDEYNQAKAIFHTLTDVIR